jgi:hypothetical protein
LVGAVVGLYDSLATLYMPLISPDDSPRVLTVRLTTSLQRLHILGHLGLSDILDAR